MAMGVGVLDCLGEAGTDLGEVFQVAVALTARNDVSSA